jgi:hypothetical protein
VVFLLQNHLLFCSAIAVVWWQKDGKIRDAAVERGINKSKDNPLKILNML